jgi:hypothetical protein
MRQVSESAVEIQVSPVCTNTHFAGWQGCAAMHLDAQGDITLTEYHPRYLQLVVF